MVGGEEGEGDAVPGESSAEAGRGECEETTYRRRKKTELKAIEDLNEAIHMIKVKMVHPTRKNPIAWPNSAASVYAAAIPLQGDKMKAKAIQKAPSVDMIVS